MSKKAADEKHHTVRISDVLKAYLFLNINVLFLIYKANKM